MPCSAMNCAAPVLAPVGRHAHAVLGDELLGALEQRLGALRVGVASRAPPHLAVRHRGPLAPLLE
jgi:hypothetical protein